MGIFYGTVNLQAAYVANKMETVDSIVIWDACVDVVPPEEHTRPLYWGYTPTGPLRKVARNCVSIVNGKLVELPPLSNKEVVRFKDPIGPLEVYSVTEAVDSLLHYVKEKGLKNGDIKIGFNASDDAKWKFLAELGFSSKEPINVKGQIVAPEDVYLALLERLPPEKKKPSDFRSELIGCVKGVEGKEKVEYRVSVRPSEKLHQELKQKGIAGSYGSGVKAYSSLLVAMVRARKAGFG
jgi:saccharopine dehydrogenase-like NADP-dependent oxidoreductase